MKRSNGSIVATVIRAALFLSFTLSACKITSLTSVSGTKSETAAPQATRTAGTPDPATVPKDFQDYISVWSRKAECVVSEPQPTPEFENFICHRNENWTKFCDRFVQAGRGLTGLAAMCKSAERIFGAADGDSCRYGHCGEASAVFGCAAVMRGYPIEAIEICETENSHIFAMIRQNSGKFCILDRWSVPFTRSKPKADGAVLCDVEIIGGKVVVNGKESQNPWYNDLSCKPIIEHYKSSCL